ncbi:site-specific tyrosine recombinase XerD [Chitinivibrio alkaliphilus]|uniref:Tyrosine recombinase XerC n=1 Tax=Chitinivibrio alkaliphilus ACht1 TaxID=1313304 RepID=U7DBG6_9BACT|nr:site-specific tyrosine recombinase XerD [Chitinivibrio alkaliphilus]ERP38903.1 tyrosine recombinase XerD [Chitinivibrio alkaliphilus ACht1]
MKEVSHLTAYQSWLSAEKGLSENSYSSYTFDLHRFAAFLHDHGRTDTSVGHKEIAQYLDLLADLGFARASIIRTISTLRSYYTFLTAEEVVESNPTKQLRPPRKTRDLPQVLSVDEIERILSHIPASAKLSLRNTAIIELLYGCGLRVSELINLTPGACIEDDTFLHITGKGNTQRLVPLGAYGRRTLKRYMEEERPRLRKKSPSAPEIFLNNRGTKLSRMGVWKIVQTLCIQAGIEKSVSPHTFRHSYATHLLEGGADLRVVQELLGHRNISTTEIYTHIDRTHLMEVHRSFHPRSKQERSLERYSP